MLNPVRYNSYFAQLRPKTFLNRSPARRVISTSLGGKATGGPPRGCEDVGG